MGVLADLQAHLATARPHSWQPSNSSPKVGGVFVCFGRGGSGPGSGGDRGWAASAVTHQGRVVSRATTEGSAGGPYVSGFLAVREGRLLEEAVRSLPEVPEVILVNATGRDHPRRAGLALHLGAVLDIPTVGVTHRPLIAAGAWPEDAVGSYSLLRLGDEVPACWVRTIEGGRPLVVHAGWRTSLETARRVVGLVVGVYRTPVPLREARRLARTLRHARTGGVDELENG
jgi:deoxyribonuclease V